MMPFLPPILNVGLDVVFVGLEPQPGGESLRTGHSHADPGNSFWSTLHASGWTPKALRPEDDPSVLDFAIGLDDVYHDPRGLRRRIERHRPHAVCFNSKAAVARFVGV